MSHQITPRGPDEWLLGWKKAMARVRDELVNNLAKLSTLDDKISEVEKHQKLTETDNTEIQQNIRDRIRGLVGDFSDIGLERQARLEALNRAALRSQIIRIREIFRRLLHEDNYADQTHTHPLSRARDYHRVDYHGNRDGNLDTSACAYRRWGSAPRAASPGRPTDIGLQLGKACYPCNG